MPAEAIRGAAGVRTLGGEGRERRECLDRPGQRLATARTVAIVAASATAIALLGVVPGPVPLLVVLAIVAGAVRGAATLLQATIVADRWGSARYGSLSGWFAAPITAAAALAPWAGTALAEAVGSYAATFAGLAVLVAAAAGAAAFSSRL